jgi:hypothetical protein
MQNIWNNHIKLAFMQRLNHTIEWHYYTVISDLQICKLKASYLLYVWSTQLIKGGFYTLKQIFRVGV